jgi:hypothetical protein
VSCFWPNVERIDQPHVIGVRTFVNKVQFGETQPVTKDLKPQARQRFLELMEFDLRRQVREGITA